MNELINSTMTLGGNNASAIYKEFMLFAIGRNINKYHRFLYAKLKKFEGKLQEKTA